MAGALEKKQEAKVGQRTKDRKYTPLESFPKLEEKTKPGSKKGKVIAVKGFRMDDDDQSHYGYCQRKLPLGTQLLRLLGLTSPLDIWRLASFRHVSVALRDLVHALVIVVLPALCMSPLMIPIIRLLTPSTLPPLPRSSVDPLNLDSSSPNFLIPYLLSPLTLHILNRGAKSFAKVATTLRLSRMSTQLPESWASLSEYIHDKRVYRKRLYDVYLPPHRFAENESLSRSNDSVAVNRSTQSAILFFPGLGVPYTAYARAAHGLSNKGHLVVVVSGEPWRVVSEKIKHGPRFVNRQIIRRVEKQHPQISEWYLVGHSLGCFTASHMVNHLDSNIVKGMVMWGVAPFWQSVNDLSNCTNVPVRMVQGSEDIIVRMTDNEQNRREMWKRMPPTFDPEKHVYTIKNGTHCGFADYLSGMEQFREPVDNSHRQQEAAADLTHAFILSTRASL